MTSGYDLAGDGASMLPEIYPDRDAWPALAPRLLAKSQSLIRSKDEREMAVGFFLFGMAERAAGARTIVRTVKGGRSHVAA